MFKNVNDDKLWVEFNECFNVRINLLELKVSQYEVNQNEVVFVQLNRLIFLSLIERLWDIMT